MFYRSVMISEYEKEIDSINQRKEMLKRSLKRIAHIIFESDPPIFELKIIVKKEKIDYWCLVYQDGLLQFFCAGKEETLKQGYQISSILPDFLFDNFVYIQSLDFLNTPLNVDPLKMSLNKEIYKRDLNGAYIKNMDNFLLALDEFLESLMKESECILLDSRNFISLNN